jgi:predicted cupin superfamily sugar epimerase
MIDLRAAGPDPGPVIHALNLRPHPEGGHYRETWRDAAPDGGRGVGTAILFLLAAGERSHWHRVDAAELWIWQAGAPLLLRLGDGVERRLGSDASNGQVLQGLVPAGVWQSAASLGDWSLCTCVVMPAFEFAGFELAPEGWAPG